MTDLVGNFLSSIVCCNKTIKYKSQEYIFCFLYATVYSGSATMFCYQIDFKFYFNTCWYPFSWDFGPREQESQVIQCHGLTMWIVIQVRETTFSWKEILFFCNIKALNIHKYMRTRFLGQYPKFGANWESLNSFIKHRTIFLLLKSLVLACYL